MSLTTRQFLALKGVRKANAEGRGLVPPAGAGATTSMILRLWDRKLLWNKGDAYPPSLWLTDEGKAALAKVEGHS